ncbi:MAG: protein kinase [Planctomycetaceae bacterium]|nr:protein kinase [Planctomycetaceae bacterium]
MNERELFVQLVEIDDERERKALLDRVCVGDQDLRARIERLVEQHAREDSFFLDAAPVLVDVLSENTAAPETPLVIGTTFTNTHAIALQPGTEIGNYVIQHQIGEGGFGVVYGAEQQQPIQRKVALKILKPGMDSREIIARFDAERQVLALMEHPHVARVLDAGTAPSGVPFFVMELVNGIPITDFCDNETFSTVDRLKLFTDVCRAVQHAHQKGIIHRDIKPSNVLVHLQDGRPVAKVIDFGIAKALNQGLTGQTAYTGFGQLIGTPLYMSPEQADPAGLDVDTRSDVYSLGVLLYDLLTGTTPFDAETLRKAGIPGLHRILCETEPPRPSTRVSTLNTEQRSIIARNRQLDSRRLAVALKGDLDWIVMKALEKDRNRRYGSPAEFAEDIERCLAGQPVEAGPPSPWYRSRKFILRHRLWLTTSALVVLAMIAGTGFSVWHAIEADLARNKAQQAEDLANARLELLQVEQTKLQEEQWKLQNEKQNLAISQAQSDRNFSLAKEAVAKLIDEVAQKQLIQYPELGEFRTSLLETAEEFYTRLLEESPGRVDILRSRAEIRQKLNRPDEALQDYFAIEEIDPNDLQVLLKLASQLGTTGGAENSAFAMEKAKRATELYPDNAGAWTLLSWTYRWKGDTKSAIPAMWRAVECPQSEADRAHVLGNALAFEGRHAEAADAYFQAAELGSGDRVEDYKRSATNLLALQRTDEAIERLNQAIALDKYRPEVYWRRAEAYRESGDVVAAVADLRQALELAPNASHVLAGLFDCYQRMEDVDAIAKLLNSRSGEMNADAYLLNDDRLKWIEQFETEELVQARDGLLERIESHRLLDVNYQAKKIRLETDRLLKLKQAGKAADLLRETNREDPAFASNYVKLGMTLRYWIPAADRSESTEQEAIAAFRSAIQVDPQYWAAHDQLSRVYSTSPYESLHDGAAAVKHAERCKAIIESQGKSSGAYDIATLGMAYFRDQQFQAAIETLKRARDMPGEAWAPLEAFLAMSYWQTGDYRAAMEWLEAEKHATRASDFVRTNALAETEALMAEALDSEVDR